MSDWDSDDEDEYSEDDDGYAGNWDSDEDDDYDFFLLSEAQEAADELARERREERLIRACEAGDAAAAARCLDFPRHEIIARTMFPIRVASKLGHVDIVRALLDRGASPFHRDSHYDPLHMACRGGHPEVVRLLLERGARAYGVEHDPQTGPDAVIPGPDGPPNKPSWVDFMPLWSACAAVADGRIMLNYQEQEAGETRGAHYGDITRGVPGVSPACVRLLLARGVRIDARAGSRGQTLLHAAVRGKHPLHAGIARTLLVHGADILCADNDGTTPLGHMCDFLKRERDGVPSGRETDLATAGRRCLIELFDRYLPAYWARTVALTLDRLPGNAVAGDENLTRQIGAFVVGDVVLRPRPAAAGRASMI